ncbi:MAG: tetratricopeptide repeat protein [Planctomycetes bacterium]|nr:tetratricopeptide repeat protein [Planctomycetota bacterium]
MRRDAWSGARSSGGGTARRGPARAGRGPSARRARRLIPSGVLVLASLSSIGIAGGRPGLLAEDTVVVAGASGRGTRRMTGEIRDFTGRELILVRASGREERIPTERVVGVESVWVESQVLARKLQAEGRIDEAIAMWRKAADEEPRTWVRRGILAALVTCYRQSGRNELAGDLFAALLESDPDTHYFSVIPLAWSSEPPRGAIESKAAQWLDHPRDAMRLVGASHLLASPSSGAARDALVKLDAAADPRVARLAAAQLWRTEVATSTLGGLERWAEGIERIEADLRAGPYFVLGSALARHAQVDKAALALLRVPIHFPGERVLAAESLWAAARLLDKESRTDEASILYGELSADYPETAPAAPARTRLQELERLKQGGEP